MPFQLSPGVNVSEIDLTTVVPAVATSSGAIAGIFTWGPVSQRMLVDTETSLVNTFGKPNSNNAETFFTAANFLSYTNSLYVVRVADSTTYNAIANTAAAGATTVFKNKSDFDTKVSTTNTAVLFAARYPGELGNSLKVSICATANAFNSTINVATYSTVGLTATVGSSNIVFQCTDSANATIAAPFFNKGDVLALGNSTIGIQYVKITANGAITGANVALFLAEPYKLSTNLVANSTVNTLLQRYWEFYNVVDGAPIKTDYQLQFGNTAVTDGMHVAIIDEDGKFSGVPGTTLEVYRNLSRATDATTTGGQTNYYKTVINQNSDYVYAVNDVSGLASNTALNIVAVTTNGTPTTVSFAGGTSGNAESNVSLSVVSTGYDLFLSPEDVDVSLILAGKPIGGVGSTYQLANYLIDNIAETRKDVVVFITPDDAIVSGNTGSEATSLVTWRNLVHDSSYAVLDSGYKYMYDRYNDVYRYVPNNGDVAGLCARTDSTRDPWWSPAGFNRGQIKNLVKLRWNPRKADRDLLYKNGINPVASFPGQGTVLYGDKTLQTKPSAFDHINVRRLFIVLEKAIAQAAKFTLFEFNDEFTRAQFKNLVTPYLRDIQGRRGITDFLVVCDSTNNTPARVDRNEFWGDIYIKPARSINYIQLNFVAVASGVQFSEVVGKF